MNMRLLIVLIIVIAVIILIINHALDCIMAYGYRKYMEGYNNGLDTQLDWELKNEGIIKD